MLDREEIKNRILNFFKRQISEKANSTPPRIPTFGLYDITGDSGIFQDELREAKVQPEQDELRSVAMEIISEFITNGLLYTGTAGNNPSGDYGFLTITNYGVESINSENSLPYDPEGYLKEFKINVPDIDETSLKYICEAVHSYNRRLLLSTTVTLGVASENIMLQFIEAFTNSLSDTDRQSRLQNKLRDKRIAGQYKVLREELRISIKEGKIPQQFIQELDTYLEGIFNFIRLNRNDAGHPTGTKLNIKATYANLQILPDYSAYILKFTNFLKTNKI